MIIRPETATDAPAIAALITQAFADAPHSDGTEAAIVERLRSAGALTVSLVAEDAGAVIGHVAVSPVSIDGRDTGWHGLGPLAVRASHRRQGIGAGLTQDALARLRQLGGQGCVVLGDPAYYGRFGFTADPALRLDGVPPVYFQRLVFTGAAPTGAVRYHDAFAPA